MEKTDAQLVKAFLEGDQSAFGNLVERYKSAVYGLAFHLLRNFADAEDIAQETFIQAYTNLSSLKEPDKFASWLRTITHNICISFLRRRKEIISLDEKEISGAVAMDKTEEGYKRKELWQSIERTINSLSEKNQLVITLYYIDGLSYKEIGDFLEIPVNTVKDRLRRAREQLKENMLNIVEEEFSEHKLAKSFTEKVKRSLEERKNITILAISSEGEADEITDILKNVVHKYEGFLAERVENANIVIFGLPVAHEDDAERAIRTALELRERFKLTAGISTGLTEVRERKSEGKVYYKPLGSVLDIALELMENENEGKTIVSESSYRLSLGRFSFREIGEGRYEVVDIAEHPCKLWGIDGFKSQMIGRDFELSQLKGAVHELFEGKGKIISIIGEAGIGKSRLVSELKAYLERNSECGVRNAELTTPWPPLLRGNNSEIRIPKSEFRWLDGRCASYGKQVSYMPFLEMLRAYFDIKADDTGEKIIENIKKKIAPLANSAGASLSLEILPYILRLLSVSFQTKEIENLHKTVSVVGELTAEQLQYKTFIAFRTLFRHIAKEQPLVMAIEDLQWIDESSFELLTFLIASVKKVPILFLCVYRPERDKLCWQFRKQASKKYPEDYDEISLFRLSSEESRLLLRELLQRSLPSSVEKQILEKAEGNPLFLEEIIRGLVDSGKLVRIKDEWELKGEIEEIDVPDTIFSVIMSRIDRLDEDTKHALRCASVIGDVFLQRLLREVFKDVKGENIQRLKELDFLVEDEQKSEYAFKHVLIKDAVYSSLLPEKRRELHERTARAIEKLYSDRLEEFYEVLVYHFRLTDNLKKRVEYLLKAGRKAKRAYSNGNAISYFNEALELLSEDDKRRAKALEDLGETYYITGEHNKAVQSLEESIRLAINLGEKSLEIASTHFKFSWGLIWLGKYDEAIKQAKAGLEALDDKINPQAALLFQAIATAYYCKSEPKGVEEYLLRNRDMIKKLGYFDLIYKVYEGIAQMAYTKGDIDSAIAWQKENENICEENENLMGVGEACIYLGRYLSFKGDLKEAIRYYEKGLEACERSGYINFILLGNIWLGQVLHLAGRDEEAEIHFLKAIEVADIAEGVRRRYTGFTNYYLGCFYSDKGDFEKSIEPLEKGVNLSIFEEGRAEEGFLISLAALERVYLFLRKEEEFKKFCQNVIQQAKEEIGGLKLEQCYLEESELSGRFTTPVLEEGFDMEELKLGLNWVNPRGDNPLTPFNKGDSSYSLKKESGWLEIQAAAGCDVHGLNPDAPRILLEISGDFAIETKLKPSSLRACLKSVIARSSASAEQRSNLLSQEEQEIASVASLPRNDKNNLLKQSLNLPSVGGLSVWKEGENFIQLERGLYEKEEIAFSFKEEGVRRYIGRGILPTSYYPLP